MKQIIHTGKRPMALAFDIEAIPGTIVGVEVRHPTMPNTVYSCSDGEMVRRKQRFFTRMPMTPEKAILEVYNVKYPPGHPKRYYGFKVTGKKELPLLVNLSVFDFDDADIQEFIPFIEDFVEKMATNPAGKHTSQLEGGTFYKSPTGRFTIQYLDEIIDYDKTKEDKQGRVYANPNYLKPSPTSMRSNSATGVIQVGRKLMLEYTIPEAIGVLLHELSHYFINTVQDDEAEADYHAATIYSGLGYGKREFYTAFWKVFMRNPYDQNVERLDLITKRLDELDNYTFSLGLKKAA